MEGQGARECNVGLMEYTPTRQAIASVGQTANQAYADCRNLAEKLRHLLSRVETLEAELDAANARFEALERRPAPAPQTRRKAA